MPEKVMNGIGQIMEIPFVQALVSGLSKKFLNVDLPVTEGIAGVPDDGSNLQQAITVLQANDPDLEGHLVYLANLSIQNPAQFKMLLGMFNKK